MAKMNLPSVNLDLTLAAGRMKAISEAASGKGVVYTVRVDQLRVLPGFNVRVRETDDYQAHVASLKQSIRENGFYPNKPLAGYIAKDGDDDVIYVTDGHTRLDAVLAINEEALKPEEEIEGLPVALKSPDSTVADLTIALAQDNTGRPLTPYEMGVVVQRLANMRDPAAENAPVFTKADIARRLSITERYIDDLNVLVGAPAKVRTAVLEGAVSSTLAIQELRKNPKKAEERITAAVAKARASGKTKATKKDVGGLRMKRVRGTVSLATGDAMGDALKALAAQIRALVPHDKGDGDKMGVDGTISFTVEVPAPPAEPKPAKAPKAAKAPAKKAAAKKAAAKPAAAKAPAPAPEVASGEDDGEPVKAMPPAVPTVGGEDPDNI